MFKLGYVRLTMEGFNMAEVKVVSGTRSIKDFIDYSFRKNKTRANWVAALKAHEQRLFDEAQNPYFKQAKVDLLVAKNNKATVGRIAVLDDAAYNNKHYSNALLFGFFEADDEFAAQALLEALELRAKKLGRGRIRGPFHPLRLVSEGFLVNKLDVPASFLTPQNSLEELSFLEAAGFFKWQDNQSFTMDVRLGFPEELSSELEQAQEAAFVARRLNMSDYDNDMKRIFNFFNEAFKDERFYIALSEEEIAFLAVQLKAFIDPNLVVLLENNGDLVAALFAMPDANQALLKRQTQAAWLAPLSMINPKRHSTKIVVSLYASQADNEKLELVLFNELLKRATKTNYNAIDFLAIIETDENKKSFFESLQAHEYRTYRVFQKNLLEPLRAR